MSKDVTITNCNPSPITIEIPKGNNIRFKSNDTNSYTVNAGSSDSILSSDFPLTVTNDGKYHKATIKDTVPNGTYGYTITRSNGTACTGVKRETPEMIVR
ncbi:MAG: hypothetical protein AB7T22_07310 [Calditrichaceae bacterium]